MTNKLFFFFFKSCLFLLNRLCFADDQCPVGSLNCIMSGINQINRTMDELAFQIDMSDSIDSGNATAEEDFDDMDMSDAEHPRVSKDFDDVLVNLCPTCSSSLPIVSSFF